MFIKKENTFSLATNEQISTWPSFMFTFENNTSSIWIKNYAVKWVNRDFIFVVWER